MEENNKIECPQCSKLNNEGDIFCGECGYRIKAEQKLQKKNNKAKEEQSFEMQNNEETTEE